MKTKLVPEYEKDSAKELAEYFKTVSKQTLWNIENKFSADEAVTQKLKVVKLLLKIDKLRKKADDIERNLRDKGIICK